MNYDKVWIVTFVNRSGYYVFSTLEKAYEFMYKMVDTIITDKEEAIDIKNELHEDFLSFGLEGLTFGATDYGYAETARVDEM